MNVGVETGNPPCEMVVVGADSPLQTENQHLSALVKGSMWSNYKVHSLPPQLQLPPQW